MNETCSCPALRILISEGLTDAPISPCALHRPERHTQDIDAPGLSAALNGEAIPNTVRAALGAATD